MYSSKYSLAQIFHFPHKSDAIFITNLQWKIQWNVVKKKCRLLATGTAKNLQSSLKIVLFVRETGRKKERKEGIPRENNYDRERE